MKLRVAIFFLALPLSAALAQVSYPEALAKFRAALQGGPVPEALARETAEAARDSLTARSTRVELSGARVRITPQGDGPLNRYAAWAFAKGGSAVVYDLDFFVAHPYAAASFDRASNTLFLPHDAVLLASPEEPGVRHESVHLETWADLQAHRSSPYYGWLSGKPFAPADLYLDEMNAYSHDLVWAAEALRSATDHATSVPRAEWDFLNKKILYLGWHTDPVPQAIASLQKVSPARFRFLASGATVTAAIATDDFTGYFPLVASASVTDPHNAELAERELEIAGRVAGYHAAHPEVLRDAARAAAKEPQWRQQRAMLRSLRVLSRLPIDDTAPAELRRRFAEAVAHELQ